MREKVHYLMDCFSIMIMICFVLLSWRQLYLHLMQYGLDTSQFTYNPSDPSRYQQNGTPQAEERSRCTIMWRILHEVLRDNGFLEQSFMRSNEIMVFLNGIPQLV
jgi:hypothetical protein